jgi:hypothetical protein
MKLPGSKNARVCADAHLPSLPPPLLPPSYPVRTQAAVHADGLRPRPHGCSNFFIKFNKKFQLLFIFFGSCCRLEKRKNNFGFQSPRSPSSAGFASEAARRRRFFQPSSPSHPSKLYSSLGWLNSKVPKPFSPFILRLIDVDGF